MEGSTAGARKEGPSRWSRLHGRTSDAADAFFYSLGYWVSKNANLTLALSLIAVISCCFGFVRLNIVTAVEDLWIPSGSLSRKQEGVVNTYFDSGLLYAVIIVESPSSRGNILTKDAFDSLWALDNLVLSVKTDGGYKFADLCIPTAIDGVTCEQPYRGVTRFWGNNITAYQASVERDEDVVAAINVDAYPDGGAVVLEPVFGNSITYDASGGVSTASAMLQTYSLVTGEESDKWQAEFQKLLEAETKKNGVFNIVYTTARSTDDAMAESVSGEIFLFVLTYAIMVVFVQTTLGRCCAGPVRRRTWLGLGGVVVVVSAGLAAYGINSAFGVPFTSLSQILPFILVGIGVDDMFVIVAAFDHTNPGLAVEERIALGLKRSGVSVTYTSLTNVLAFALGSTSSLPAVEYFCFYAATAILFDFVLQVTAFVALLAMDANRQKAGRVDWCCCFKSTKFLEEEERAKRGVVLYRERNSFGADPDSGKAEVHHLGAAGRFMRERYAPFILSATGKVLVLLGTGALLAAGIYGATQVEQGFDLLDLAPDDHHARDYANVARKYELEVDSQYVTLGIYTLAVDYPNASVQAQLQATDALMAERPHVVGPVTSWLTTFLEWADNTTEYSANVGASGGYLVFEDPETFYPALNDFIEDEANARFKSDIVYTNDGEIEISRSTMFLVGLTDTQTYVDSLMGVRDVAGQSELDPEPFGFSFVFIYVEQFVVIYRELLLNFLLALVAVAVLSFLVLGKAIIVLLVCLTVATINVDLLGFVYHWGLEVNGVTVVELVMAVGLVVDYMVHIVHYFLHQDAGTPKDVRIADALGEIGPSVLVGAATTFVGIMPMAFASNVIFRTFFRMFLVIITFGFWHGVVFIPVALSILPDWTVASPQPSAKTSPKGAPVIT